MIYLCTGKVGSGKSLLATQQALDICAKGGCVVSNIHFSDEGCDNYLWKYHRRRLAKGQLRYHDFEEQPDFRSAIPRGVRLCNVHVFCDEAQLFYNSARDRELKANMMPLLRWLTQSRKFSVDVTFITQAPETLWSQFRYQALFSWKCRDMRVLSVPLFGNVFSGLRYSKLDIMSGEILSRHKLRLHPDLFKCYDTTQTYDKETGDLLANAELWEPISKHQNPYPYALVCNCCGRHRSNCLCGPKRSILFWRGRRKKEDGGREAASIAGAAVPKSSIDGSSCELR